ncbi:MAG: LacI family DNA-binding transcriptional regulator [Bariatricus sp.]
MTIKDIARKCGVGISTVSRALNDHPDINPETKERILKTVAESDFVPNSSARNLKRTDAQAIAVLVKEINDPFFATMMQVLEQEIRKRHYAFFIRHMTRGRDELEEAAELIAEKRLRGLIFLGGSFENKTDRLKRLKVPFVVCTASLSAVPEGCLASWVATDDREASRKIVDYLCETGHRSIAILASDKNDSNVGFLRMKGYEQALKEHGIALKDELVCYLEETDTAYSMENGYRMMRKLLKRDCKFTAVFAISDLMAVGAIRALREAGKRIPQDVAVAGFDGLAFGEYFEPPITTMVQPAEEIAKESVEILFQMIESQKKCEGKILPAKLAIRKSTEGGHI